MKFWAPRGTSSTRHDAAKAIAIRIAIATHM